MKKFQYLSVGMTIVAIILTIWVFKLKKDLRETEEILEMCSDRYYQKVGK